MSKFIYLKEIFGADVLVKTGEIACVSRYEYMKEDARAEGTALILKSGTVIEATDSFEDVVKIVLNAETTNE